MNSLDELRKKSLSHSFADILVYCSFNGRICTTDDFSWKFDVNYGNCYQFNRFGYINESRKIYVAGPGFGLQMIVYTNFHENLTLFNSYSLNGNGLMIQINNNTYLTDHGLNGIYLPVSFDTRVSMERSFSFSAKWPYSECLIDDEAAHYESDLFQLILNSPYQYTQPLCIDQCYQNVSTVQFLQKVH
jgi:hypothetical protein